MQTYQGFLLATAGSVAAAAGSAQAADMAVKAPVRAPVVAAASWAGFYIGGHAGGAWQNVNAGYADDVSDQVTASATSFIGGGQIGYNWQRGNFVSGFEIDGSWLSKGPRVGGDKGNSVESDIKWLATARLRMGLAINETMIYVTGGVAFGGVDNTYAPNGLLATSDGGVKSDTKTKVGWVIGGGIEHMWTPNWTIALEGLFVDLGKNSISNFDGDKTGRFSNQSVIGRLKMNYKF